MKYQALTNDEEGLLLLSISGTVGYEQLLRCFSEVEELLRYNFHLRLIIDGSAISHFDISNEVCQQMAPGLFNFVRRAAFFSPVSLVFGMMRVMHACSFNDNFGVFRTREQAQAFLIEDRASQKMLSRM
ncbi:MAG: hypothetical protein KUG79_09665 [Pseudomonadales bacterium]|nr:hypothetical protein [Pseudomonadales bacterium]